MTTHSPAAPPAAPASPPDPPAGGAAGLRWPQFTVLRIEAEYELPKVLFACAACGLTDVVDVETGLCRPCWRPFAMLVEALREMREELVREIRGEKR